MSFPEGWYDDGFGKRRWWDGQVWTDWVDLTPADEPPQQPERTGSLGRAWLITLLSIPSLLVVAAIVVTIVAFATAETWTKVDVPEQAETFHTEQYQTGKYIVTDNNIPPCFVGQDWIVCRNLMVAEYNRECAERQVTSSSALTCDAYGKELDRMEEIAQPGWIVESLGSFGYLSSRPETSTRKVSNNDYRPAITHEATCYLGFLGECR